MTNPKRPFTDRLIYVAAGYEPMQAVLADRRSKKRLPYHAYVAMLLVAPTGERGRPVVVRARDISIDGISVVGRQMIYPGSQGALQLVRSDGSAAVVGVTVKASRYVGDMKHHTGMAFSPLPQGISAKEFVGKDGRLLLLDPRLRENVDA